MQLKKTVWRLRAQGGYDRPPAWRLPTTKTVTDALSQTIQGAPAPSLATLQEAFAAYLQRHGAAVTPTAIRFGIRKEELATLWEAGPIFAVTEPDELTVFDRQVAEGHTGDWDAGYYRGVEYISGFDEIDWRIGLPAHEPGLLYIAQPSLATGVALTARDQLRWVRYAEQSGLTLIADASFAPYLREAQSFYAIEGAASCVLTVYDFAALGLPGLTAVVVPDEFAADRSDQHAYPAADVVRKYLGTPDVSPLLLAGLHAWLSDTGQKEWKTTLETYAARQKNVRDELEASGIPYWGEPTLPYLWLAAQDLPKHEAFAATELVAGEVYGGAGETFAQLRLTQA